MILRALVAMMLLGVTACAGAASAPKPTPSAATVSAVERTSPDRPNPPTPEVSVPGMTAPPPGEGARRYAEQKVDWGFCRYGDQELQCTQVLAPLDWSAPDGEALSLFVVRMPAARQPSRGTIFVNPGGPGEPGSTLAPRFQREGLEDYDIVAWDPRGTGLSTAVRCGPSAAIDDYLETDNSPDDPGEREAYAAANRAFGQACLENSGRLLQHISTPDTVADLELLRQLMGEEKLNFFGYSYGTDIGSRYAHTYPDRVGRMALDGAVNVTESREVTQAAGFDRALVAYADWCAAQRCALGRDRETVLRAVTELLDGLDQKPLPVRDRTLTQSQAVTGVVVMLYGAQREWEALTAAVERARAGDGSLLLQFADFYNARGNDGAYDSRLLAFTAIRCLDQGDEGLAGADRRAAEELPKAPVLGPFIGPDYACPTWPVRPIPPLEPVSAPGAPPILVIGTTGDPATPFEFAVTMAQQLQSGVLLTYEGAGHGAYGGSSACVDQAVVRYFTSQEPPAAQTCR